MAWQNREMLIWGRTYPELSSKYTETVCTGAIFTDGQPGLVRIYPLDARYMPKEHQPKKWRIITAGIDRNPLDKRPESYKINASSVRTVKDLPPGVAGWRTRMQMMLQPNNVFPGLEAIEARQKVDGTSLGIVKVDILDAYLVKTPPDELAAHRAKYKEIVAQKDLWAPTRKPMPLPRYKARIKFRASGDSKAYDRLLLDWEGAQLAAHHFNSRTPSGDFNKGFMKRAVLGKDPHLILGNIHRYPHTFVVVSVLYPLAAWSQPPKPKAQTALF